MYTSALKLLDEIKGAPVLCVGDIMVDRYIYGEATRLSPEAPVPVVTVKRELFMPGGVGNVVKNLGSLGVLPLAVSVVGEDANSGLLAELFMRHGYLPPILVRDPRRPTSVKTRVIAGIQQLLRFDQEESAPLEGASAKTFLEAVERQLPGVKAVALSDYGKGVVAERICRRIIELAREHKKPVVVDPKGGDYSKYAGATLITPNRKELAEASRENVSRPDKMVLAARRLMVENQIENMLVTRSEEGMMLLQSDAESPVELPALAREVFDVSGAGDTVVAVMAAALAVGAPLALGAALATLAAAVVVGKVGTATAGPDEIRVAAGGI